MRQLEIVAPQLMHADLMTALQRVGGLVQHISGDTSTITVRATVQSDQIQTLENWLLEVSGGKGRVIANRPVDGADA